MTFWIFAKYMGIECKWLLFIPVYRYAFIGIVENAYAFENGLRSVDFSVVETAVSTITFALVVLFVLHGIDLLGFCLVLSLLFWFTVRTIGMYVMLYGFRKHALFCALISWIPGIFLYQALYLRRNGNVKKTAQF